MSITESPAEDAVALLDQVIDLLGKVHTAPLWKLGNTATLELLRRYQTAASMLAGGRLRAVAEVDSRGAALGVGASSTAGWLRGHCGDRPGTARAVVALAEALTRRYPDTLERLCEGLVSEEAARVIAGTLDEVPAGVDAATMAAAEADLLAHARSHDPGRLARIGAHLLYVLDPDGAKALAAEEARMFTRRHVHLNRTDQGWWRLRGRLDPEAGAELAVALDTLAKPIPSSADGPDPRDAGQRRADALTQMVDLALAAPGMPTAGGHRPMVLVTIPYPTLLDRPGAGPATFDDGTPLSAQAARRIACDTQLLPIVLGAASQPLDVGRARYTPSTAQRLAVLARQQHTCGTPHCHNQPRHIHHIKHWADGGPTDIDNLVALCGHCHRLIHTPHSPWTITPTPGGNPTFTPHGPAP